MLEANGTIKWRQVHKVDEAMLTGCKRQTKYHGIVRAILRLPKDGNWYHIHQFGKQKTKKEFELQKDALVLWLKRLEYPKELISVRYNSKGIYAKWLLEVGAEKATENETEPDTVPVVQTREVEEIGGEDIPTAQNATI